MAKYSDDPVRHVVTFRVNSEEKKVLEQLAKESGRTVSDFMRRKLQRLRDDRDTTRSRSIFTQAIATRSTLPPSTA